MNVCHSLATFSSVDAMNEAVRKHLYFHAHELTKTEKSLLKLLSRFSCKILGVSWPEAKTLAAYLEVSVPTVWRSIKKLESLGIIQRLKEQRRSQQGKFSSSIYLIQPSLHVSDTPSDTRQMIHGIEHTNIDASNDEGDILEAETIISKTIISYDQKEKENVVKTSIELVIDSTIPDWFIKAVRVISQDPLTVTELWNSVIFALKKAKTNMITAMQLTSSLKSLRHALRKGTAEDIGRFFYGAIYNQLVRKNEPNQTRGVMLMDKLPASVQRQIDREGRENGHLGSWKPVYSQLLGKEVLTDKLPESVQRQLEREQQHSIKASNVTTVQDDPELREMLNRLRKKYA